MPRKQILGLLFLLLTVGYFGVTPALAQGKFTIKGEVTDAETRQPISYANIIFVEMPLGTSTNDKGEFSLRMIPAGNYTLSITYLGYTEFLLPVTLTKDMEVKIVLQQQSLGLKEVTVTAEHSKSGTTASRIRSDAISHVQASSLKDVMQLIPGNLSSNPNLREPERISIREVGTNVNSSLGTSVIIDGIPISNDGNLQKSISTINDMNSVAGGGVDIRGISVDNIESITVDVGIPSAEHGNLTSGILHIKTKAGGSPLSVRVKADPYAKQGYAGKGIVLGKDRGILNVDFDYTRSYGHIVKHTSLFNRANASIKYSRTLFRDKSPLEIESKIGYNRTLDGEKWDPDMVLLEENYSREQGLRASFLATWKLNKGILSDVSFDAAFTRDWQKGFEKTMESSSSGATFFSTATESGEYQIFFGPSSYYSEVTYDGQPYNLYLKFKARSYRKFGHFTHNAILGTEWTTTGNNGDGRTFDPQRPPSGLGTRPRAFSDIPALHKLAMFAEEKFIMELGTTRLDIMAGVRMDNIQPSGIFNTRGSLGFDPRINIRYQLLNKSNNRLFRDLSFRMGYGKTTKAPTLLHLYPEKDYNDIVGFNYYPELIVTTTTVIEDTRNYDLEPARSDKKEVGLDFQIGKTEARITAFSEKHTGGYILDNILFPQYYRDYDVIPAGLKPYYQPGDGVYYKDLISGVPVKVGYEDDVRFASWSMWRNGSVRVKEGIEYSFDFGKIEAIRTSVNMQGAWFRTESFDVNTPYWEREDYTVFENGVSSQHFFGVKFPTRSGYGIVDQRFNTNIGLDTHIPELKMLVSLTTQIVWFEKNKRVIYEGENHLYSLSELRNYLQIPDLFTHEKEGDMYYYLPISHMGYDHIEIPYSRDDFNTPLAQQAIKKLVSTWFPERTLPPLVLCNIKLSKEIGKRLKLSFYANNFLNIRPWHLDSRSGQYLRRNEKPFFGADLTMEF